MSISLIYVTTPNKDEALRISSALLEERLIACANALDSMTSVYRWSGSVQQDNETMLLLKTRTELVPQVISRVREMHSYECPCLMSWPIAAGNPDYLHWIMNETPLNRDLLV